MAADVDYIVMWMNISEADELAEVYRNVKWIQVVTSMLSIVGSGSIIGYAVFQNAVRSPEVRPLFYLSLSDLFLAFCWLIGVVVYKADTSGLPCFNLQAVGQMFYLSTILYTINFVWQTFSNFRRRISHDLNQISDTRCCIGRIATVLCSCLVLNIGSQVTDNTHRYDDCAVLHTYTTSVFMTSFCLATLCILAIVAYSCRLFKMYQKDSRPEQDHWAVITATRHSFLLFPSIFLFCSLPVVTLTLVSLKGIHSSYQALCYIQAFTAISQGFLNSLAYGWTQQMIRCLKQNSCRDVDTQTPLLRSQKNLYASMQTSNTYIAPRTVSAF
ncbi:transmembrane protein 116 isoform X2 [Ranitomeya imitator]|uniref:transmembrane protein 116 isoform X2 n=1 Tax=Ranitomeya imitator TaxID=111125 RepID=UPI0037E7230F